MDSKKSLIIKKKDSVRKNLPLDPEALDCDCDSRKDVRPPVVKTLMCLKGVAVITSNG